MRFIRGTKLLQSTYYVNIKLIKSQVFFTNLGCYKLWLSLNLGTSIKSPQVHKFSMNLGTSMKSPQVHKFSIPAEPTSSHLGIKKAGGATPAPKISPPTIDGGFRPNKPYGIRWDRACNTEG